jgi:c-di-GMP phosphodiesterase
MNQTTILMSELSNPEVFLGRQPILDQKRKIVAYELLFRSANSLLEGHINDDMAATSAVIINTLSQFGIHHVISNHLGFINVSASFLLNETLELLPPDRIVLEILEDVPITTPIIQRCKELKELGFKISLNNFKYRSEYASLLPLLDFIKVNVATTPTDKMGLLLPQLRKYTKAKIIAENVELESDFVACSPLGFDLYQGFFFAKPVILQSKKPQSYHTSLMRIMGMLLGDANLTQLEPVFKDNPSLSINLLRLVNSVAIIGSRSPVSSLRQAIVVLGQKQLLRWVQLLLYASPDGTAGSSLLLQVANRARLMELLANKMDTHVHNLSDQAFMVGMLSMSDVVMHTPLTEVLNSIGLSDEMRLAILQQEGVLGALLSLSEMIEASDFAAANDKIRGMGISVNELTEIQLQAMQWSSELESQNI